jgi:hypothetical protein
MRRAPTIRPGARLRFPNVLPSSRAYDASLPEAWRKTLSDLNVSANQPRGTQVVVDKSEGVLRVLGEGDKLIAQFPATMGSEKDPLPIGTWTIKGASYNPPFHYNPTCSGTPSRPTRRRCCRRVRTARSG